jgi:hypothetical protein
MRSDISHTAMTKDFVLQASSDQSELSNVRDVTQSINEVCPIYSSACTVVGSGTPAQANAQNVLSSGKAGCSSTSHPHEAPTGWALVFGAVGLVVARTVRQRRSSLRRR